MTTKLDLKVMDMVRKEQLQRRGWGGRGEWLCSCVFGEGWTSRGKERIKQRQKERINNRLEKGDFWATCPYLINCLLSS